MRALLQVVQRWQTETGDANWVSLVRAILGGLLLVNAGREMNQLEHVNRTDVFHVPIVPEVLVPPRGVVVVATPKLAIIFDR